MGAPEVHRISGDITRKIAKSLNAGDQILYSGIVLTARDAAHKRLVEALDAGEQPPIDIDGAVIYYAGPAPAKPGYAIGPVGPTSSYRMDPYAPRLLDLGQRAMIGKGARSQEVIDAVMLRRNWGCRRPHRAEREKCRCHRVRRPGDRGDSSTRGRGHAAHGRHRLSRRQHLRERPEGIPGK